MSGNGVEGPAAYKAQAQSQGWPAGCEASLVFEAPELSRLCGLWRTEASAEIPLRSSFGMRALSPVLDTLCIAERVSIAERRRYYFRLLGPGLTKVFAGSEGRFLDQLAEPSIRTSWTNAFDTALNFGRPLRFLGRAGTAQAESFIAPLRDEYGEARMVLSATCLSAAAPVAELARVA